MADNIAVNSVSQRSIPRIIGKTSTKDAGLRGSTLVGQKCELSIVRGSERF